MNSKDFSPFTPGKPVPVDLFVGRIDQIKQVTRFVKQSTAGCLENIFLLGERGIGKSSFASLLCKIAAKEESMVGIYVNLGYVSSLEDMVRHIFNEILNETREKGIFERVKSLFGSYVKEVDLFGLTVSFEPPAEKLKTLVERFPEAINNLLIEITKKNKGLIIVLDDINGLAEKAEFANWYKSFADEIAIKYDKKFPVAIVVVALPEKRDKLTSLQPSLMRVFRVIEINKLSDDEVRDFYIKAFKKVEIEVMPEALSEIVKWSGGLPIVMHEIGDAVYYLVDSDMRVDGVDIIPALIVAANSIGRRYLDPKVSQIKSENYISIISKLGESFERNFNVKDLLPRLTKDEEKVLYNFLDRLRKLEIIEIDREKGRGAYRFINELYPAYFWFRAQEKKHSKK